MGRHELDAVEGRRDDPVPPETGRDVIALTEAAYRAADDGRPVDVQGLLDEASESA